MLLSFGSPSASAIAEATGMDKGQLSRRIKTLGEKGLLDITQSEEDHRRQILVLSQKGHDVMTAMTPIMQRRQTLLTQGISDEDMDVFFSVLGRLSEAAETREIK